MNWFDLPKLINIINNFSWETSEIMESEIEMVEINFSDREYDEVVNSIVSLMDNYITNNPLEFSNPQFETNVENYVISNLCMTIEPIYPNIDKELLIEHLIEIYNEVYEIYFNHYCVRRSFKETYILQDCDEDKMEKIITYIENKPQPTQQTNEWYTFRHNILTASSLWKVFKSQSTINQLVCDKCAPLNLQKYDHVNTQSTLHHGHKYEPLSIMYYEHLYNTKVEDYGCIQHDKFDFLGASPDGINVKKGCPLYGRMLEIKNIVNREINGIPKEEYWIQMQLQMETCDLDECDFLETQFTEYENEEEFNRDGSFQRSASKKLKGVIIYFMENGKPFYQYSPIEYDKKKFDMWYDKTMEKYKHLTWVKNIYWKLEKVSCVLVLRNKHWFENAIDKIRDVWNIIVKERETGYEHRLPVKKTKARKPSIDLTTTDIPNGKCMINVVQINDINNVNKNTLDEKEKEKEKEVKKEKINENKSDKKNIIFTIDT